MADFAIYDNFANNDVLYENDQLAASGFSGGIMKTDRGTVFLAVQSGEVAFNDYTIRSGMYGCGPRPLWLSSYECCALVVTVKRYVGIFSLGGPLEAQGRLRYIDGCTDTPLIQPLYCGEPCLNYLHFPPGIRQTEHHHPSDRIGLVYGGGGLCHHAGQITPMRPGNIFVIPVGTPHWFETGESELRIVAFHPDSEVGPTDDSHQMRNATLDAKGQVIKEWMQY